MLLLQEVLLALALLGDTPGHPEKPAAKAAEAPAPARTQTRLTTSGQRNENVAIWFIDTNAVKEANIRVGTTTTAIPEPLAETHYFAAEHGRPPAELLMLKPASAPSNWHGEGFWSHQNSIFNARTFFQVGSVKPSHRNFYGGRLTGLLPRLGAVTATFSQGKIRGMVNGNVLVPLANERTPLATDPAVRAIVQRFLDAYPNELPNRTDFDPRALNTNSPQRINNIAGTFRLDTPINAKNKLLTSYSIDRQQIIAFQLVAGQNPDTEIHNHKARMTWQRSISATTQLQMGVSYNRNRSALYSEPNAVGPRVRFGYSVEELGPDSSFPVNRATNTYRYGAALLHQAGRHQITAGADVSRFQLNGIEANNIRGQFQFGANFGRSSIENLRLGTPNMFEGAVGELSRGYRNWTVNGYVADKWKLHPRFQLYYGLRYTADTRPVEVQNRETIPYPTDANNFSPRVSLAWQAGQGWVVRAMYTTTFGQILPVTYQQIRNNPPSILYVMVPDPYLANPLRSLDLTSPNVRYSPTWLSSDLSTPYSHQYNTTIERKVFAGSMLRLSYIGSRTIKLLNTYTQNRAEPIPGMALTTSNVDARRADARYYDVKHVVNGGIAYYDGGQVAWDLPLRKGLIFSTNYTFSKAIDEGNDFTATAANKDISNFRSQYQYDTLKDRKGLSNFDSTHAFSMNYAWDIPAFRSAAHWLRAATSNWQISGANMWKKGTPLTLFVGSDGPGYGNVDGGGADRPNLLDPTILGATIGHPDTAPIILSRNKFAYITPGQHAGTLGRGTMRKSSIWNWNASVARQFRFPNELTAQLRAEAFNLSNTPQFDEPQRNLSSPAFGKITNTLNDGRVFQLGLRFVF
ncbi:TonB-dependent receptor [uncultured Paludibaculum sp.]|uniref:TonB-dependent receptor n=1 Tax=uncultured Paludibaculum sp. TaxID=1765020 RepID=UPI002AAC2A98|nr:TonB-dependent receptor [uncultured Paludibaculum sp.]